MKKKNSTQTTKAQITHLKTLNITAHSTVSTVIGKMELDTLVMDCLRFWNQHHNNTYIKQLYPLATLTYHAFFVANIL